MPVVASLGASLGASQRKRNATQILETWSEPIKGEMNFEGGFRRGEKGRPAAHLNVGTKRWAV